MFAVIILELLHEVLNVLAQQHLIIIIFVAFCGTIRYSDDEFVGYRSIHRQLIPASRLPAPERSAVPAAEEFAIKPDRDVSRPGQLEEL